MEVRGDEVSVYEMPYGAEIVGADGSVVIRSRRDAEMLIESLARFVASFAGKKDAAQ